MNDASKPQSDTSGSPEALSERQTMVLRALVSAYVAEALPVSSGTLSHLLPVALSSASIRATMSDLSAFGLIEKQHASAGRAPTQAGFRYFLRRLLETDSSSELPDYERRALAEAVDPSGGDELMHQISQHLSVRTRQLGFALKPNVERLALANVSFVRLSTERVLVVLVARNGQVVQRIIEEPGRDDQAELEAMAVELNGRIRGRTLPEVHADFVREIRSLRAQADRVRERTLAFGLKAMTVVPKAGEDLVLSSRRMLFEQPEFSDPDRVRGLFEALDTNQRLLEVLAQVLEGEGVSVSLGDDLAEPGLRDCALVAVPYGETETPNGPRALGVLGVLGPNRMDYSRIIPLVSYCSRIVTDKLNS